MWYHMGVRFFVGEKTMQMQAVTCPNCNGEIQLDTSRDFGFCSYCGTKIMIEKDAPLNATEAFTNNREAALGEIRRVMDHFSKVAGDFTDLDHVNGKIKICENKTYTGSIVTGSILSVLGLIMLVSNASVKLGVACIGIAVLIFAIMGLSSKSNNDTLDELHDAKKVISKNLITTYEEYLHCPLGIEYCRPEILQSIYEYLRKGRAETIKEAVNLLEMEEYNAQMLKTAQQTQALAQANLQVNTMNAINNIIRH